MKKLLNKTSKCFYILATIIAAALIIMLLKNNPLDSHKTFGVALLFSSIAAMALAIIGKLKFINDEKNSIKIMILGGAGISTVFLTKILLLIYK